MVLHRVSLVLALLLFLGFSMHQIDLPGLHYDEAFEVVPTMQLMLHQPVTTFRDNGLRVGDRLLPLMTQDYIGAINTYLAVPFFAVAGIGVASVRLMGLAVGLLTLLLTCRLARELISPLAGSVAALLLAVNPTFIFWSRQGVFVTSVTAAIGLAAALTWLRWWRTGDRRYAIAGTFLFGLGLYAKLLFLWLIVGLGLAAAGLLILKERRKYQKGLVFDIWYLTFGICHSLVAAWRTVVLCCLAFLLGAAPLLAYNLQTGGTLSSVGGNLTTSYYGTNNLAFIPNLAERVKQFGAVLVGSHLWYLGGTYANWLNLALFLVALGCAAWLAFRKPRDAASRAVLLPFMTIGGVILASCATVSALWVTHFAVLTPWPPIAIAVGVVALIRHMATGKRIAAVILLAMVGLSWGGDIVTAARYHQALTVSGGLGTHSDAIGKLAAWLTNTAGERRLPVAAMDWGIAAPVTFLTRGKVTPVETFGYAWESDAQLTARLTRFIQQPDSIYLWRAPDEIIFDRSQEFKSLYQPLGLEEDIVAAFYERSGRPVLGATRLVPRGAAKNPPQPINPE